MSDKILIVDDDFLFRNSLKRLLESNHANIEAVATGVEAISRIRSSKYAAVILDLGLPDLEGMEIAFFITEKDPNCSIIILTGQGSILSAKQAVRFGCFDYLTKPCHADQVNRVLTNAIENRRLKLELDAAHNRNKRLAEASWESIAFFTKKAILEVNEQFCSLFDVTETYACSHTIFDFIPELSLLLTPGNEAAGQPASKIKTEALHPNGTILPVELRLASLGNGKDMQWVVVIRDLTQFYQEEQNRERLEKKLTNAQRMESIGVMAGSVAHDLNNLLSSMVTLPELLLLDMPENAKYRHDINKIQKAGKQAAAVVSDLLTITRGSTSPKEVRNINAVVEEYKRSQDFSYLKKTYPNISIEIAPSPKVGNSRLSSIQVLKSIVNLVRNGLEAIESNGAVTIHTSNQCFKSEYHGFETIPGGEYAVLTVADTGVGIENHHLEHIFKPFYTNKKPGDNKGTGLGLTVIEHTMRDHYGYIDIRRGPVGTIFELYFPVIAQQLPETTQHMSLENLLGQGETILIVDDEREQRDILGNVLNRLGYNAETVGCGEKAIEFLQENSADLIVLDMVMAPGINGYQTLKAIRDINPEQKAVITSGQLNHPDRGKTEALGVSKYLGKPLTLSQLAKTIRDEIRGNDNDYLDSNIPQQ